MSAVTIRHFTDPACPFAFSAERQRHRLLWLYGDQIDWQLHMVVLREEKREWQHTEGYRAPAAASTGCRSTGASGCGWRRPSTPAAPWSPRACAGPTAPALLLRRLRVLTMAGQLLDDSDTLELAAAQAGLPVAEIAAYCAEPEVEEALRADMRAARSPSPASRAQDYKLGGPPEERRYTCPSYELLAGDARVDLPGYRPIEAYETALANLEPSLTRRPDPESVDEVLAWAPYPLATAEIAAVCDREIPDVRAELARTARFEPVGADGYWSL